MNSPLFKVGDVVSRLGKCKLQVCGVTHEGEYILYKLLRAQNSFPGIPDNRMQQGMLIQLPGTVTRYRLLLEKRETNYWVNTDPFDLVVMSEEDLQDVAAEVTVSEFSGELARTASPMKGMQFLPRNTK